MSSVSGVTLKRALKVGLAISSVLICSGHLGVLAEDKPPAVALTKNEIDPGEASSTPASRDAALRQDAAALAAQGKLALEQALQAVNIEEMVSAEIENLRTELKGRVAGVFVERQPTYKVVVRLKGSAKPSPRSLKSGDASVPVAFVTDAPATVDELVTSMMTAVPKLKLLLPNLLGIGTDEKTGEVVVTVRAAAAERTGVLAKLTEVGKLVGQAIRIETSEAAERLADIRGGSKVDSPSASWCTSGFSVKRTDGVTGVLTAGHCEGINNYYNSNGTRIALSFSTELFNATQDVEVHTSGYVERPEFYADSSTSARVLTGRRTRASTAVGQQVCHRGATSGYSCGLVSQTNYAPTTSGACGTVACSPVYIRVAGDAQTACAVGDSGGPVFIGQTAVGILKMTASSGSAKGQCTAFTSMSTDTLPSGWSLIYGP